MCGIAGFYDLSGSLGRDDLGRQAEAAEKCLLHRGPDAGGIWIDEDLPLVLTHRRLSIVDLSESGAQPKASHSGRYIVIYNGEIYNFPDLKSELEDTGASFKGTSDTEVLLAAVEYWGFEKTLEKLNGMFAFALWDRKEKTLYMARDRVGKKPLYIGWAGSTLVFASELKVFHQFRDFEKQINRRALQQFMAFSCIHAPLSIYRNVWQLPPGHKATLQLSGLEKRHDISTEFEPYWQIADLARAGHKNPVRSKEETLQLLKPLLQDAVRRRMISDVPLGAFLSGGIDSSLVTALMQEQSSTPVKTYTIGFENDAYNEANKARDVASHLGTAHHELVLTSEKARNVIPDLPQIYDEPFADESQIPMCLLAHFTRQHVTVALSGDGGDEMFGGYTRHQKLPGLYRQSRQMPALFRQGLSKAITALSPQVWDVLNAGKPRFGEKMHKAAAVIRSTNLAGAYNASLSRWLPESGLVKDIPAEFHHANAPDHLSRVENLYYYDMTRYLPDDILVKVDRATMAYGLEARAPLLEQKIAAFSWRVPPAIKMQDGKGKWPLREILKDYIPDSIIKQPKQGFSVPIASWLAGPLNRWASDLLDPSHIKQQGYLDADLTAQTWKSFQNGRHEHAHRLWNILMWQSWLGRWH